MMAHWIFFSKERVMGVSVEFGLREKHTEFTGYASIALEALASLCVTAGIPFEVAARSIGEPEYAETTRWRLNPDCKVTWDWRSLLEKHRKKPKKIEAAFYSQGVLCGLMYARVSRSRVCVNVRYIEGSPCPLHPLKGLVATVALLQADLFARVIKAKRVTISQPAKELIGMYTKMSFDMTDGDKRLIARGAKPRYHQLVRDVSSL